MSGDVPVDKYSHRKSFNDLSPLLLYMLTAMALFTLTDSRITAPALIALMYFPKHLQKLLPSKIGPLLKSPLLFKILIALVGFDVLRKSNRALSKRMINNGAQVKFRPGSELVLITGGSSGLGLLMAKEFARRGVKVVILDLNPPTDSTPANLYYYKCDVRSVSEISESAAEIRKEHGDPTVLINNAGIGNISPILESTEESIKRIFEINIMSHFSMTREYLPAMIKKNHGHVVTIASFSSFLSHSMMADYCCTKSAALAFHESLACELVNVYDAPNIRTTTVHPAYVRTPLTQAIADVPNLMPDMMEPDYVIQKVVNQVMSGESGEIILPNRLYLLSTIRSWPLWAQKYFRSSQGRKMKTVRATIEAARSHDSS